MKLIIVTLCFVLFLFKANSQTVTNTTWTGVDSITYTVHDSVPDSTIEQKINHVLQHINPTFIPTQLLSDRTMCLVDYNAHTGDTATDSASDVFSFISLLSAMNGGAVDTGTRPFDSITAYNATIKSYLGAGVVPILVLAANFNSIDSNAVDSNLFTISGGQVYDVPGRPRSPYLSRTVFSATPFQNSFRGRNVTFIIPSGLVESNMGTPTSYHVDFGDGNGLVAVTPDVPYNITYSDTAPPPPGGTPFITYNGYIAVAFGGVIKNAFFSLHLTPFPLDQYGNNDTLHWDIPAASNHSGGKVTIALGCGNNTLTKPLIVVKGFDPTNDFNYFALIDQFRADTRNDLKNEMVEGGYDLVWVDYNNNLDSIERNARYLEAVINRVNAAKAASGSSEKNIIIGISMGGLVSRWCLKTMENESHTHDVKTFISFDAPQRGAYVPLCAQYLVQQLYYLKLPFQKATHSEFIPDNGYQQIVQFQKVLTSRAAQEMLVMQATDFKKDLPQQIISIDQGSSSSFTGATTFLQALKTLGYPANCRNVSISNGSQVTENQGYSTPFASMATITGTVSSLSFIFDPQINFSLNSLPNRTSPQATVYHGGISLSILGIRTWLSYVDVNVVHTDPLENAPGGIYDVEQFDPGFRSTISSLLPKGTTTTISHTAFSFIPTVSSLDINPSPDPFSNIQSADIVTNHETPFLTYVAVVRTMDTVNELHAQFSSTNLPLFEKELGLTEHTLHMYFDSALLLRNNYNYGANTTYNEQTNDRLGNIEVYNAGLYINTDIALGEYPSSLHNPTTGSNFDVYTVGANCDGPVTVTIDSTNSHLWIGDSTHGNTGTLWIDSASSLWVYGTAKLNPNCRIVIQDGASIHLFGKMDVSSNSSIVVQKGGTFSFKPGAKLNLQDTGSVLDIGGTLDIPSGATFALGSASKGYVRFYQVPADAGTRNITGTGSFVLSGTSSYHKVLQVDGGEAVYPQDNQTVFKVTNGKIVLGHSSRLNIGCPVALHNVVIDSHDGSGNNHRGLNLYGQTGTDIDSVRISNGDYGVYAPLFYGGHGVALHKVEIVNCSDAVVSDGETVEFDTCRITGFDDAGWLATQSDGGFLTHTYIYGTGNGIDVTANPGTTAVTLQQSHIQGTDDGLNGSNVDFFVDTCQVTGCQRGINTLDGDISMDPTHTYPVSPGRLGDIHGNNYGLYLTGSGALYLNGGFNDLTSSVFDVTTSLTYCVPGGTVAYGHNKWNSSGSAPSPTDYSAGDFCFLPPTFNYTITDASPLSSPYAYTSDYHGPTALSPNYLVDPEFNGFHCNSPSLEENIRQGMLAAQNRDYATEARIFNGCIKEYLGLTVPDDDWLHKMYKHLISGAHQAIVTGQVKAGEGIIDSVIVTQDLLNSSLVNADDAYLRYSAIFDKAGLKRLQNNRTEALHILASLEANATPEHLANLQYLHCIISAEQSVLSGNVPKERFAALIKDCPKPKQPAPLMKQYQTIPQTAITESEFVPVIYPNPAGNAFSVLITAQAAAEIQATITNPQGQTVYFNKGTALSTGQNTLNFTTEGLPSGVYLVHLAYNGKDYREKLVVTRP